MHLCYFFQILVFSRGPEDAVRAKGRNKITISNVIFMTKRLEDDEHI